MFSESSGWSRRCVVIFFTIATYCLFLLESEQRPKLPHLFITCQFPSYLLSSYLFFQGVVAKLLIQISSSLPRLTSVTGKQKSYSIILPSPQTSSCYTKPRKVRD
ncbi:hypothetical protein V6000_003473 [Aspergillus fumigatus]